MFKNNKLDLSILISLVALIVSGMAYLNSTRQAKFSELSAAPIFSLHNSFSEEEGEYGSLTHKLEVHTDSESLSGFSINNVAVFALSITKNKSKIAILELIIDDYFHYCGVEGLPDTSLIAKCETENNLENLFQLEDKLRKQIESDGVSSYRIVGNRNYTRIQYLDVWGEEQQEFLGSTLHGQLLGEDFEKSYYKVLALNEMNVLPSVSLSNSAEYTHSIISTVVAKIKDVTIN